MILQSPYSKDCDSLLACAGFNGPTLNPEVYGTAVSGNELPGRVKKGELKRRLHGVALFNLVGEASRP